MTGAIIILLVTVAVGLVLYVYDMRWRRRHAPQSGESDAESSDSPMQPEESGDEHNGGICCGRHLICEKSLVPEPGEQPVYYDDEELDRYAGRDPESYTDGEVEEFRDVLLTLLPDDVPGWVRSIQLRGIRLPQELRDEVIMLVGG